MNFRAALRAALWAMLVLTLGGCAALGLGQSGDGTVSEPKLPPQFKLEVDAPSELRELLLEHLDLAKLQTAPEADSLTRTELDRLIGAAAAQAHSLLETEGYFNARVQVQRVGDPESTELPLLRMQVEPGPRALIDRFTLQVQGELDLAAEAGDEDAAALIATLRRQWPMQPGAPFEQSTWNSAKNRVLAALRSSGYLAAEWSGTAARVDADDNTVRLFLVADSGPLFRLGSPSVGGLERYDAGAVVPVVRMWTGQPATEQVLRELQERLAALGMFESVVIDVDTDPQSAAAAPLRVAVRELTLQTATVGIGFSDDVGAQLTLEHTHRRVFGTRWIAKNKIQLGTQLNSWQGDLISHPLEDGYRNLVAGQVEKLRTDDETRFSWRARAGRTTDGIRIWRLYYGEYAWAKLETSAGVNTSSALSGNYHWGWRNVDNLRAPTKGVTLLLKGALGWSQGEVTGALSGISEDGNGPFARVYGRAVGYWPLAENWFGSARLELGQVFVQQALTVPDTLLFRAGGDDSVRGYAYRSLGPEINGAVVSGSHLFTASVQVEHPIVASQPDFLWAVFADVGNAANSWRDLKPVLGYGVGVHWRSPVGPLRLDLAYGQELKKFRLSFSVGVVF
jgi:translocation and assembly module TamA